MSKVKLATEVEGEPKAPFLIATTPRCIQEHSIHTHTHTQTHTHTHTHTHIYIYIYNSLKKTHFTHANNP